MGAVRNPKPFQQVFGPSLTFPVRDPGQPHGKRDVLSGSEYRNQVQRLEHKAEGLQAKLGTLPFVEGHNRSVIEQDIA